MNCGVTMAAQSLSQLPAAVQRAATTNAATIAAFRPGAEDAARIARELPGLSGDELQRLEPYTVALRLGLGPGQVAPVCTVRTLPLGEPTTDADALRRASSQRYGGRPKPSTLPCEPATGSRKRSTVRRRPCRHDRAAPRHAAAGRAREGVMRWPQGDRVAGRLAWRTVLPTPVFWRRREPIGQRLFGLLALAPKPRRPVMTYLTSPLASIDPRLTERDRDIAAQVGRLRLLSHGQLRGLFFADGSALGGPAGRPAPPGATRRARRAGPAGAPGRWCPGWLGGLRLHARSGRAEAAAPLERPASGKTRAVHEPGGPFVAHTLACSELFVRLVEADRRAGWSCWSTRPSPTAGAASSARSAVRSACGRTASSGSASGVGAAGSSRSTGRPRV